MHGNGNRMPCGEGFRCQHCRCLSGELQGAKLTAGGVTHMGDTLIASGTSKSCCHVRAVACQEAVWLIQSSGLCCYCCAMPVSFSNAAGVSCPAESCIGWYFADAIRLACGSSIKAPSFDRSPGPVSRSKRWDAQSSRSQQPSQIRVAVREAYRDCVWPIIGAS